MPENKQLYIVRNTELDTTLCKPCPKEVAESIIRYFQGLPNDYKYQIEPAPEPWDDSTKTTLDG